MGWLIKCSDEKCRKATWIGNIVDLISSHRDQTGWFLCQCGQRGYVEKSYALQEAGEKWEPYLRGIIPLGGSGDTYQPFVFLVSNEPDELINEFWFSYYKDLRESGGRLKLGYGPGGPPVLNKEQVLHLLRELIGIGSLSRKEIDDALR